VLRDLEVDPDVSLPPPQERSVDRQDKR